MKFSFVIPSINQFNMLFHDCINTLIAHNGADHEIIVVDDGSEQRLQSQIAQECVKRNIHLLINQTNLGFPRTVNKGMKHATGDIIVLVNNDIKFTRNVTQPLMDAFEIHPKVGIVGSLLYYPHGTIQHGGIVSTGVGSFTHKGWHKTIENAPECQKPEYLIGVTGALFAIKREAMNDIGFMNEEYFLACDDTEYCLRSWQKNWRVLYYPQVTAIHAEGATRGKNDVEKLTRGRTWFIKERETQGKFHNDLPKFDWVDLHNRVHVANLDLKGLVPPTVTGTCEKKLYGNPSMPSSSNSVSQKSNAGKIIAVRRTGALGDVILTTGVLRRIRQQYPEHDIWYATVCPDVFKNNPNVQRVVRTIAEIPSPDLVIDFDQAYELKPKMPMVEAYAERAFGDDRDFDMSPELYSTEFDYSTLATKLGGLNLTKERVAVLHMAVGWDNRTMNRTKWNEVSKKLVTSGYKVVVIGRGADYRSDLYGNVLNLVDNLTIHEIRELMKRSAVFVGMDSGMLHIAMTTDIPAVGLFTVANPDYRIIKRNALTAALSAKVTCRFCLHEAKAPVNFIACKYGTNSCLDDFTSDSIVDAVRDISK